MSRSFDLDPAHRFTTGAIGVPGERSFFLQAESFEDRVTIATEKEQVHALAEAIVALLERIPEGDEGIGPIETDLDLREPLEPEWRAGTMALQFDEETNRVMVVVNELVPRDEEGEPEVEEGATARFVLTRAQARAVADHALEVVAAGRPRCNLCDNPLEPDQPHVCPSLNGHRGKKD